MSTVAVLAVRGLVAGIFVVAVSMLSELLRPKSLAGVFAAAPSIAAASLLVTLAVDGEAVTWGAAVGMIGGAAAMLAASVVAIDTVRRLRATRGALAASVVWLTVASCIYAVALR